MNPLILNLLLGVMDTLGRTLPGVIDALHRTGELTDAEWIAAKARYENAYTQSHWTPEVKP